MITLDVNAPTREITPNTKGLALDRMVLESGAVGTASND